MGRCDVENKPAKKIMSLKPYLKKEEFNYGTNFKSWKGLSTGQSSRSIPQRFHQEMQFENGIH
eukprot:1458939-Ditylum_brightwellii.AAC.1